MRVDGYGEGDEKYGWCVIHGVGFRVGAGASAEGLHGVQRLAVLCD